VRGKLFINPFFVEYIYNLKGHFYEKKSVSISIRRNALCRKYEPQTCSKFVFCFVKNMIFEKFITLNKFIFCVLPSGADCFGQLKLLRFCFMPLLLLTNRKGPLLYKGQTGRKKCAKNCGHPQGTFTPAPGHDVDLILLPESKLLTFCMFLTGDFKTIKCALRLDPNTHLISLAIPTVLVKMSFC
jgi:hypothetical protein